MSESGSITIEDFKDRELEILNLIANGYSNREYYEKSLNLRRAIGSQWGEAFGMIALGSIAYHQGEYEEAEDRLQEGIALARQIEAQEATALGLAKLGFVHLVQERREISVGHLLDAVGISYEINTMPITLEAMVGLGRVDILSNETVRAIEIVGIVSQHPPSNASVKLHLDELYARLEDTQVQGALEENAPESQTFNFDAAVNRVLETYRDDYGSA